MKLHILAVGKIKNTVFEPAVTEYVRRVRWPLEHVEIPVSTPHQEMLTCLQRCPPQATHILLDAQGELMDSMAWAQHLQSIQEQSHKHLVFWIGGPEGFCPEIFTHPHCKVSLGRMTWPHLMVRMMLMEQIYRAQQILSKHPYHK